MYEDDDNEKYHYHAYYYDIEPVILCRRYIKDREAKNDKQTP